MKAEVTKEFMDKVDKVVTDVIGMKKDIEYLVKRSDEDSRNYVERKEFEPVRNLVYGLVGLILVAFVGAIIALVIPRIP